MREVRGLVASSDHAMARYLLLPSLHGANSRAHRNR